MRYTIKFDNGQNGFTVSELEEAAEKLWANNEFVALAGVTITNTRNKYSSVTMLIVSLDEEFWEIEDLPYHKIYRTKDRKFTIEDVYGSLRSRGYIRLNNEIILH